VGVTWFARTEAADSHRWQLAAATGVMLAGIALLWWLQRLETENVVWLRDARGALATSPDRWAAFWGLLAALVGWRCLRAIAQPTPRHVQAAVKHAIMSLILLDAAAATLTGGMQAAAIVILMLPAVWLGRWVYST
jgi:4-hydroxybenzoate polyprenyltransferase